MKTLKIYLLLIVSLSITSCVNDDLKETRVVPLNLSFEDLQASVTVLESQSTPSKSNYKVDIQENSYVSELITANANDPIVFSFDIEMANDIFTYDKFDILIDNGGDAVELFGTNLENSIVINNEELTAQHPTHPSLGLLTSLKENNNEVEIKFSESGKYTIKIVILTEENNYPIRDISRSYLNLSFAIN